MNKEPVAAQPLSKAGAPGMLMEQSLLGIQRMLEGRRFDSFDDLNAFLADQYQETQLNDLVPEPRTAEEKAQALVYQAYRAPDSAEIVALAKEALSIDPYCSDAYLLLAYETAETSDEALELYRKATDAARSKLPDEYFESPELVGRFWAMLDTRPYMRAREALASTLWDRELREEAVEHYQDLLRLCPNDNMGLRYQTVCWLIACNRYSEARKLLREHSDDPSAIFDYVRAFLCFKKEGPSRQARKLAHKAFKANPHVLPVMALSEEVPPEPDYYGFGDENEAIMIMYWMACIWERNQSALFWLVREYTH